MTDDTDDFLRTPLSDILLSVPSVGFWSSPNEIPGFCSEVLSLLSVVLLSVVFKFFVSPGEKYSGFLGCEEGETSESGLRTVCWGVSMIASPLRAVRLRSRRDSRSAPRMSVRMLVSKKRWSDRG